MVFVRCVMKKVGKSSEEREDFQKRVVMQRVIHFELSADEVERAIDFYSTVFGWNIQKKVLGREDYYLIHTGPQDERGINGGLKQRGKHSSKSAVTTIGVPDIKAFSKKIVENGGKIVQEAKLLPQTGYLAYCEDTEGNLFAILQYDADAKS